MGNKRDRAPHKEDEVRTVLAVTKKLVEVTQNDYKYDTDNVQRNVDAF